MRRRITTRWYIGAWVVSLIALIALIVHSRALGPQAGSSPSASMMLEFFVMAVAGLVMLVMVIGALLKLGIQQARGWFIAVLLLHLVGLGIIGMVAYAVSGPEDNDLVVIRPSTPV